MVIKNKIKSWGVKMLNKVGTKLIETERLILRKFTLDDSEAVFKNWASDEEGQSLYCEPAYKTKESVDKLLIDKYIANYKDDNYYRWAIILKNNNECIGQIAYFLVNDENNFAEIEYCIGKEFQGHGYATEACKAVIGFGFNEMKLHKVQICHMEINNKSKRVIEKCGLTYEGTLRDFFYDKKNDKYISRLYYSILKSEYDKMENK